MFNPLRPTGPFPHASYEPSSIHFSRIIPNGLISGDCIRRKGTINQPFGQDYACGKEKEKPCQGMAGLSWKLIGMRRLELV